VSLRARRNILIEGGNVVVANFLTDAPRQSSASS
jgi:hypothetical protein